MDVQLIRRAVPRAAPFPLSLVALSAFLAIGTFYGGALVLLVAGITIWALLAVVQYRRDLRSPVLIRLKLGEISEKSALVTRTQLLAITRGSDPLECWAKVQQPATLAARRVARIEITTEKSEVIASVDAVELQLAGREEQNASGHVVHTTIGHIRIRSRGKHWELSGPLNVTVHDDALIAQATVESNAVAGQGTLLRAVLLICLMLGD